MTENPGLKAGLALAFQDVFKGYRPMVRGREVPVGTWRLKLWVMLGPVLRDHRMDTETPIAQMEAAIWSGYHRLEDGTATLEEYNRYFWDAWAFLDNLTVEYVLSVTAAGKVPDTERLRVILKGFFASSNGMGAGSYQDAVSIINEIDVALAK